MVTRLLPFGVKIEQEDPRIYEARKRVKELFEREAKSIHALACKPHSCDDPLTCTKDVCFEWQPDKIASETYTVERKRFNYSDLKGINDE